MISVSLRAQRAATLGTASLAFLSFVACKDGVAPQQPDGDGSPAAAEALYSSAMARFTQSLLGGTITQEAIWQFSGLLTDEFRSSDASLQRTAADRRATSSSDALLTGVYDSLQNVRTHSRSALRALQQYEPATSQTHQAELYFTIAFAELQLGEDFCNGIPLDETVNGVVQYALPLATAQVFGVALAQADSGLALVGAASDSASTYVRNALLVTKGRLQVDLGQFSTAAATVAPVPIGFQYVAVYSPSTFDNGWWVLTATSRRYSVADSVDATGVVSNALPFASANDPRVPTTANGIGSDGTTPFVQPGLWNRDDPVQIVSGLDAQLIKAEAALAATDFAGMTNTLNALRAQPPAEGNFKAAPLPAMSVPTNAQAAVVRFFREKAFWTFGRGQRLGDMRRMVRQYAFPTSLVYPTGPYFKGGTYGSLALFPVPDAERINPNFTGCIDQRA